MIALMARARRRPLGIDSSVAWNVAFMTLYGILLRNACAGWSGVQHGSVPHVYRPSLGPRDSAELEKIMETDEEGKASPDHVV